MTNDDPEAWRSMLHNDLAGGRARKKATRETTHRQHDSYAWEKRAKQFLAEHSDCLGCKSRGRHARATIADHIVPINQGGDLMHGELQALCQWCHQSTKRRLERVFRMRECTKDDLRIDSKLAFFLTPPMCRLDGTPDPVFNPYHPWAKK
jgi:hypothetical protein